MSSLLLSSMTPIKLRPHHVSRIIDHYQGYMGIKDALQASGNYSIGTINRTTEFVEDLIGDPSQQVEIIGNDEIGEDSICALCDNNSDGKCTLPGSGEIKAHNSTDQREALRYGLQPGVYTLRNLLERRQAFHPKVRI